MKRDAAQTIFRTVVFAGAMLGANACGKKPPPASPTPPADAKGGDPAMQGDQKPDPCAGDPCAGDPCGGRARGADEDGGGGAGRGFILS